MSWLFQVGGQSVSGSGSPSIGIYLVFIGELSVILSRISKPGGQKPQVKACLLTWGSEQWV